MTRAETRLKNKAEEELVQFTALLRTFLQHVADTTGPEFFRAFVKVIENGMGEIPVRMLASNTITSETAHMLETGGE